MLSVNRVGARSSLFFVIAGFILIFAKMKSIPAQEVKRSPPAEPPVVPVSQVVEREVTDYEVFAGRFEAAQAVNIVGRVTGYLTKVAFEEGSNVKQGDLLFEVDARPYQAQVDRAEAEARMAEAHLKFAQEEYQRTQEVAKTGQLAAEPGKAQAAQQEAQAALAAANANLQSHRLMLGFCQIVSPIDGRAGRCNLTPGNLVKQDETVLTTVVSLDPSYLYFDIDEHTLLRLIKSPHDGKAKAFRADAGFPVFAEIADETGFPHQGIVSFINNQVDPAKGTITVRGTFQNPPLENGGRLFMPGMFARVRFPMGETHQALLVSDNAVRANQGSHYVLVVSGDDSVDSRPVTIGQLQDDGLRVVEQGLKPGDRVVVGKEPPPQTKIRQKLIPMPTNAPKQPATEAR